jgi:pimeloyl-ACP methyl ester carboxylesterase
MGGALAVQFTLDHPEMSEGLVCAASNSGPGKHEGGRQPANWASLAGVKRAMMSWFYDKSLVTDELVRSYFEHRLRADDGYTIERHLSDHRPPYSVQELSAIRVPALFVWCRQDEITPLKWGEDYATAVPGAELAVIDRCGHFPNLEEPRGFNQAIIDFLNKRRLRIGKIYERDLLVRRDARLDRLRTGLVPRNPITRRGRELQNPALDFSRRAK